MAVVLVHVTIAEGYHGKSWLMETEYDMDFLPDEGDRLHPLKNDTESGLSFEVARRWWGEDGKTTLEITKYVIDPPDGRGVPRPWRTWWSDRDGDLVEQLLANGWWEYGKRPE